MNNFGDVYINLGKITGMLVRLLYTPELAQNLHDAVMKDQSMRGNLLILRDLIDAALRDTTDTPGTGN